MARGSKRHRQRYLLAGAMFAILLGSCATLPPAKSVTEIRTIAGSWAGDGSSNRQGDGPIQLVISEDGSVDAFLPRMGTNGTAFKAKLWIENGQIRYETAQGTWIGTRDPARSGRPAHLVLQGRPQGWYR